MSYGPPLPSAVVPIRMLPNMPHQEHIHPIDPDSSFTPSSPTHPHPLRSHSASSKHSKSSQHSSQSQQSIKRDSGVLRSTRGSIYGSGGDGSYEILADDEVKMPPLPSPTHLSFRNSVGSTKRLGNSPMAIVSEHPIVAGVRPPLRPTMSYAGESRSIATELRAAARPPLRPTLSYGDVSRSGSRPRPAVAVGPDYPIVASRPPLRPTVSFGGESRMSYYSPASGTLGSRSQVVAAQEQLLQRQQRIDVRENASGKIFAYFGIPCLQRFVSSPSVFMASDEHYG